MRKAQLLSTVAAVLLMSAGVASAQSMQTQAPARAPAAQQNAPAEKAAPPLHSGAIQNGERKRPETTGQSPNESRTHSNKPMATGGDNTGSDRMKGNHEENSRRTNKSDREHSSEKMGRSSSERNQQARERSGERSNEHRSSTTTGQGAAAGAAKLSTEQRSKIVSVIKRQNVRSVERTSLNVSVNVGTRIPASVHLYPLPAEVVTVYPQWQGYDYILVGDQIVVVEPGTHEIVYIIES